MRIPPASFLFVMLGLCLSTMGQSVPPGAPIPPGYGPPPATIYAPPYSSRSRAVPLDLTALQREAKELLELSQSVPPDIELLKRDVLRKDLLDKLKRIEKISKHLRNEIAPMGN
jgi:hypothetical protein